MKHITWPDPGRAARDQLVTRNHGIAIDIVTGDDPTDTLNHRDSSNVQSETQSSRVMFQ
jgi:hypothetical protein